MKKYWGFRTWNISHHRVRRMFVFLMLGTASMFAIAGGIAMLQAKSVTHTQLGNVTSHLTAKTLIMLMAEETPYLKDLVKTPDPKGVITNLVLEVATSIDPSDPRTFLGRELPMFALFDTRIVTASADADYTNIPIESPPPPEIEEQIKQSQEETKPTPPPVETSPGRKRVFIYHSHWWESYLPELKKSNPNQASDVNINIMSVGNHMADTFQKLGIGTQTTTKPKTGWSGAYLHSRKLVVAALQQHEDIQYLIDIHRDSKRGDKTTITINGKKMARMAFVVGKDSKYYSQNLQLAKELFQEINRRYPGLCTGVYEKAKTGGNNGEYNQSLSTGAMLVEVGGVDNSFAEAKASVDVLANVIADRIHQNTPLVKK
ncbi:stage II sporulation protein P [Risungbinella massiliensis]|uniref:stage II sporulation protein P n=1 Tax=Risungbinella massiliensis TaxID=1329796 RepID=UPI0005CC2A95|nr:stage II sporulation protein P [Risungbinella massiliensis]